MIWAIPSGFYGKLFTRSGILREDLVTVDAGVIDSDFRSKVAALLFNHHPEKTFTVRAGDRIVQIVFMEKFTANFQRVADKHLLGITKCGSDGFGSTTTFEKATSEEAVMTADKEVEINGPCSEEPQIASEEAIMSIDDKVIVNESKIVD